MMAITDKINTSAQYGTRKVDGDKQQQQVDVAALASALSQSAHLRKSSLQKQQTYSSQGLLPRLPIPSLEETLDKLPKALEALQTPEEQEETLKVVEEFRNGEGPKLQQLLVDYEREGVASGRIGSYVEEAWNDSYLTPNDSVVLNLNPFFVLEKHPDPKVARDQIHRAASLSFASLKMASLLKKETLPPDTIKGKTLCMDQFKALFGSTRVPEGKGYKDHIHVYPNSTHVVVLIKQHIYYFQALWPEDSSVAVNEHDIKDILEAIKKHANSQPMEGTQVEFVHKLGNGVHVEVDSKSSSQQAIGVLTSLPRAEWAAARQMIVDGCNDHNREALHVIESALFVLVLDDHIPKNPNDMAANMLHGSYELAMSEDGALIQVGSCCTRWYDKLQLIVCADGTAGVNFEHSAIDGHTALRYGSDIFAETIINFAQSITQLIYGNGWIPDNLDATINRAATSIAHNGNQPTSSDKPILDVFPKQLTFDLPDEVVDRIHYAETALGDQINASDTIVLEFHGYGKNLIVKNSLSPDSFVQLSIMLAYYRLYGRFVNTYEPVMTKTFYHGRTEAMRGATPQAKRLCQMWNDRNASKEQKLDALRVAAKEHSRLVRECAAGKGVDRHLFALKSIAARNNLPTPALFESEAWSALNHTVLSTSNCGNPSLRMFGFGPVVPDGFGIGYIIKSDGLQFSVSSKHRQTPRFVNSLENTLKELKRLLNSSSNVVCASHGTQNHSNHAVQTFPYEKRVKLVEAVESSACRSEINSETNNQDNPRQQPPIAVAAAAATTTRQDRPFSNVQRKSLRFSDIKNLGLSLSFNEDTETASSSSSFSEDQKVFEC